MQNNAPKKILRIVAVSDTHDSHKNFLPEDFPPADIFIHAGDFTRMSRLRQFRKFREFLQSLPYKHKIVIPGNHDFGLQLDIQRYKAINERFKLKPKEMVEPKVEIQKLKEVCTLLIHQMIEIQGVKIFGSPFVISENIMGFTYLPKDGEAVWSNLPQDVDVLVTHCPPFGIMDQSVHSKLNTGCKGLLQAVVKMKPKLHIFGHIHEGHGHIVQEDIRFYNVAYLNAGYSPENKPVVIEIEVQAKVNDTQ